MIEAQARDDAGQIPGRRVYADLDGGPAQLDLLHDIFGLADGAEHAKAKAQQPGLLRLEIG